MRHIAWHIARPIALAACLAAAATQAAAAVCTASVTPLAFGVYESLLLLDDDSTGVITVTCTPGATSPLTTSYTITIAGTGATGDTLRSATQGSNRLYYQVYSDAARTAVWGNGGASGSGVASSVTSATVATPASRTHVAYARLRGGQRVPPGLYSGSLLVTVDY